MIDPDPDPAARAARPRPLPSRWPRSRSRSACPCPSRARPRSSAIPPRKGAQMFVEELNAKGGVLGRKIELIVRDSKADANEAVRVARELILKDNVDFLVGTLTSAEGPAVSVVAKENKIVFIAPDPEDRPAHRRRQAPSLRLPRGRQHHHRGAQRRRDRGQVAGDARSPPSSFDYAYGQDVTKAFVEHMKKIKPSVQIVDQQWPKLGEQDYNPFINAQMAKKPEAIVLVDLGRLLRHLLQAGQGARRTSTPSSTTSSASGEAASPETTKSMGADYPVGIWGNSYDAFYWDETARPPRLHGAAVEVPQGRVPVVLGHPGLHRHAVPRRGDQEGGQHRLRQGRPRRCSA